MSLPAPDWAPDWTTERRRVLRTALGIGVATGAYGVSFGALSTTSGLSLTQTCALSVLVFTGASQFAFVGVHGAGGDAAAGAATALLLGSRNALYGLRLAPLLRLRGLHRLVGAQLVIDESTAVAVGQAGARAARLGFWAAGLAVYLLWNTATLLGALAGDAIGDPRTYGLDAAVPAAVLALLARAFAAASRGWWRSGPASLPCLPCRWCPVGAPVLLAALVAVAAGLGAGTGSSRGSGRRCSAPR
jgi:predicted branched-subunit amino acid permease